MLENKAPFEEAFINFFSNLDLEAFPLSATDHRAIRQAQKVFFDVQYDLRRDVTPFFHSAKQTQKKKPITEDDLATLLECVKIYDATINNYLLVLTTNLTGLEEPSPNFDESPQHSSENSLSHTQKLIIGALVLAAMLIVGVAFFLLFGAGVVMTPASFLAFTVISIITGAGLGCAILDDRFNGSRNRENRENISKPYIRVCYQDSTNTKRYMTHSNFFRTCKEQANLARQAALNFASPNLASDKRFVPRV